MHSEVISIEIKSRKNHVLKDAQENGKHAAIYLMCAETIYAMITQRHLLKNSCSVELLRNETCYKCNDCNR